MARFFASSRSRLCAIAVAIGLVASACGSSPDDSAADASASDEVVATDSADSGGEVTLDQIIADLPVGDPTQDFGPAPPVPEGDYSPEVAAAIDAIFGGGNLPLSYTDEQQDALRTLADGGDPRVAWILLDALRFTRGQSQAEQLAIAANGATGLNAPAIVAFGEITDHLLAWDIPAPPNYTETKRAIYATILPEWSALFESSEAMDWRLVSWGGVAIDDRPFDTTDDPCNCIPAADNPETQPAAEAGWLEDDDVIFGVVINGEARAYPRQIMEVREMVNDTLGGRDFGMPYCTLCGSAQVWFTDELPDDIERPVLRTSGLLSRSNKVMYDLTTFSVFDTFLGTAQTGPHAERGLQLEQHTVVTSTWADWVAEHPDTDVLIEDLALGRDFDFRNGRDADGPIFPIGDVDPRLDIQEDVLGVLDADGNPVAFHVNSAIRFLESGGTVEMNGISLVQDGSGVRAEDTDGNEIAGHQAFWFAWSQFHPDTLLWPSV